jgi:HPt (histidine-containing phosphotransfer) domain-containing protein
VGIISAEADAPSDDAEPVLDPENVEQLSELGDEVLAELTGIFLSEAAELRQQIAEAIEQADADRLRFAAHRMRSGVRTWGAYRLDRTLGELEEIGAAGHTDGSRALLPELDDALALVLAALEPLSRPGAQAA